MENDKIIMKVNKRLVKRMEEIISLELALLKEEKLVNKKLEQEYEDMLNNKNNIESILTSLEKLDKHEIEKTIIFKFDNN